LLFKKKSDCRSSASVLYFDKFSIQPAGTVIVKIENR
jgi:hypothetical protein